MIIIPTFVVYHSLRLLSITKIRRKSILLLVKITLKQAFFNKLAPIFPDGYFSVDF